MAMKSKIFSADAKLIHIQTKAVLTKLAICVNH